jgi:two-component system, LuxR family, response regulator FixJ
VTWEATIYIVDDDDAVRDALLTLLVCEGFSVVAFASAADFLRHVDLDGPACLVVDVHMPGMTGIELLERLRSDKVDIPAIVMTGAPNPVTERATVRAGASLLTKPFRPEELVDAIGRALRRGAMY